MANLADTETDPSLAAEEDDVLDPRVQVRRRGFASSPRHSTHLDRTRTTESRE